MRDVSRRNVFTAAAASSAIGLADAAKARPDRAVLLTQPVEEGPYYLPGAPGRADITEGLAGVPVELRFEVLDETGTPLPGARLDIWHCDAQGRYSGFGAEPRMEPDPGLKAARFLRGTQTTDAAGAAVFHTVYPGWYMGRTTHVHYKVWRDTALLLTSQGFFPDALNEFLYTQSPAYLRGQTRDTLNSTDHVARTAGEMRSAAVTEARDRYLVRQTIVVDKNARNSPQMGPRGPGGPFGPGPPPGGMPPPPGPHGRPPFGGPPAGFGHPPLTGAARLAALLPGDKRGT